MLNRTSSPWGSESYRITFVVPSYACLTFRIVRSAWRCASRVSALPMQKHIPNFCSSFSAGAALMNTMHPKCNSLKRKTRENRIHLRLQRGTLTCEVVNRKKNESFTFRSLNSNQVFVSTRFYSNGSLNGMKAVKRAGCSLTGCGEVF